MDKGKDRRSYRQSGSGSGSGTKKTYLLFSFFFHQRIIISLWIGGRGASFFLFFCSCQQKKIPITCYHQKRTIVGRWFILLGQIVGNDLFKSSFHLRYWCSENKLSLGPLWGHSGFILLFIGINYIGWRDDQGRWSAELASHVFLLSCGRWAT